MKVSGWQLRDEILRTFNKVQVEILMEYDILVEIKSDWNEQEHTYHIYFTCGPHTFECLKDLKKALNNKAFW